MRHGVHHNAASMRQANRVRTRCVTAALLGVCAAFGLCRTAFALHPDLVGYDPSGQIRFDTPAEADGSAMMLHWQMIFYLVAGFAAGIIVSL